MKCIWYALVNIVQDARISGMPKQVNGKKVRFSGVACPDMRKWFAVLFLETPPQLYVSILYVKNKMYLSV